MRGGSWGCEGHWASATLDTIGSIAMRLKEPAEAAFAGQRSDHPRAVGKSSRSLVTRLKRLAAARKLTAMPTGTCPQWRARRTRRRPHKAFVLFRFAPIEPP